MLDTLGEVLEYFYEDGILNSHLLKADITVYENKDGNKEMVAKGIASEIKDALKDKYDRKIIKWDSLYHIVNLTI